MGFFLNDLVYGLTLLLHLAVLLIALEWAFHFLPGVGLHPVRRFLFNAVFPFSKLGDRLGLRGQNYNWTPGVMIVLILLVSRLGLPWIAYFGFSIRG
ncbi:MAG: hypothetical protein ACREL1_04210 [bacterium]